MGSAFRGRANVPGLFAAVLAGVITVGYLGLIAAEGGGNDPGRVALVASTIGGAATAAWIGSVLGNGRVRSSLLGAAAGVLLSLGYLALFSIGILLILAGILAVAAAVKEAAHSRQVASTLLGFVVGLVVVLGPLLLSG